MRVGAGDYVTRLGITSQGQGGLFHATGGCKVIIIPETATVKLSGAHSLLLNPGPRDTGKLGASLSKTGPGAGGRRATNTASGEDAGPSLVLVVGGSVGGRPQRAGTKRATRPRR